jgi:hypothetical protein
MTFTRNNAIRFFSGFFLLTLISSSHINCKHSPSIENLPEVCFERDILPIFLNNCTMRGCHDGTGESELRLNNYSSIIHGIKPGNPDGSRIYRSITGAGENRMPPDQPLSIENRTRIMVWIQQGAGMTTCASAVSSNGKKD